MPLRVNPHEPPKTNPIPQPKLGVIIYAPAGYSAQTPFGKPLKTIISPRPDDRYRLPQHRAN